MLRREEAQEQLTAFAGDATKPALVSLTRRLFAGPLVKKVHEWSSDPRRTGTRALGLELDGLDDRQLARTFGAVCPPLGDPLARWWRWSMVAPYQLGWQRRGFRSSNLDDSRFTRMESLRQLLRLGREWPQDVAWFATWLSHLPGYLEPLAGLLASEISSGRSDIADTLTASAFGRHPISGITTTGIQALLGCDRPECWEPVVTLLRTAGRQEGLRSTILEATDLACPGSFRRILDVVVADGLTRFAGTVRAAGVWFGEELTVRTSGQLTTVLTDLAQSLDSSAAPPRPGNPAETFTRLWAAAFVDARQAIPVAADLLRSTDAGTRRSAARLLAELGLDDARDALLPALDDPDLSVYATAVSAWPTSPHARDTDATLDDDAVEVLLRRVRTLGKPQQVDTGVIGSRLLTVGAAHAADVILANRTIAAAPVEALAAASAQGRWGAAHRLAKDPGTNRAALFGLLTDGSSSVRRQVFDALATLPVITPDEAGQLEGALRRKSSDLRQHAITLLLRQPPEAVAASAATLRAGTADQVRAAAELAKLAGLSTQHDAVTDQASIPDATVAGSPAAADDEIPVALRYRVADRTPAVAPAPPPADHFARYQPGCKHLVSSLRAWLAEHSDVEVETGNGVELLANLRWLPPAPAGSPLPLAQIIGPWWERTSPTLTDGGVELLLLQLAVPSIREDWALRASRRVVDLGPADLDAPPLTWQIITRLARREFRPSWIDIALDAASAVVHDLPLSKLLGPPESMKRRGRRVEVDQWGYVQGGDARTAFADVAHLLPLAELTPEQLRRLWQLARYVDEPEGTLDVFDGPRVSDQPPGWGKQAAQLVLDQPWRHHPSVELLARAVDAGTATRGDLLDALLRLGDGDIRRSGPVRHADDLPQLTARRLPAWAQPSSVQDVVSEVRDAAISGEFRRGDLPVPLTPIAKRLRSAYGIPSVTAVLAALGRRPLTRGYSWTESRESSLSHLVRIHAPRPDDTAERLSAAFAAAGITPRRAIEFGVYAPQWAGLIEAHLGWPGFESAVWWVHAHTKDDSWGVDREIRDEWNAAVSQRTPLDAVDLVRGAADVDWFNELITELGVDRFKTVLAAAKYASSAGGHKRAELFAQALLGRVDEAALLERIRGKRHQDSVRALGLLPLSGRTDPALLARYELIRGFVASDRTSGSQRRASETTAAEIGLENLARTAGYRDPGRLTWAMEAEAVRDLAAGPVTARDGDVTVTLTLDADGAPQLTVDRAGKTMKSVPAASAKVPAVAELKTRVTTLRQQARRMRRSLEQSCVRGERFNVDELADLLLHPVLAPMLRDLVFVSDEGVVGFASPDARLLVGPDDEERPVDGSALRVAHPVDLLASGEWPQLQHALFTRRRVQPFRQLFRELYIPTATELDDGPRSRRYSGQQIEARQAAGLFTSRGWVADFEVGFSRTYHQEKITAWCSVLNGLGTAAEVEDAAVEDVTFVQAGTWKVIPVGDVPPRLFSETMRDLDLVVSVAHAGRVDPETTESSIEMRRRLVEETADLLGLDNVEVTGHHARIKGKLGTYSVQLGSGVVHRIPGNAICIIPVSAQHRGRIFLPFADDDPRTAEVISKVLLLARDDRIQDPTILQQLT
ncbi:DUF4132 domain-containing protein [Planosporangium flavigriseum]|uniref:DUF4132 domain-containing protein n=1 Tax=Planosporangium flavigriseum TaxID=373681 RepID=A0A8J3LWK5_9ACTN|nr:DUF5724 domain-containing protein [Planosporangium flavigriseum]NJC63149.1 DUF4132 domain-containing protein [Planosporangium flavigriseum]GIG72420.1 hypothetical protein Pfl04_08240 [Planosporangium flavigriseum]